MTVDTQCQLGCRFLCNPATLNFKCITVYYPKTEVKYYSSFSAFLYKIS